MAVKDISAGLRSYAKANRVIFKYRLWPYMAVPGIMSFLYISSLIWVGSLYVPDITSYISQNWIPGFLQWGLVIFLTKALLWVLLLLTGYITYQPVIIILFSPVLSFVSEVTEQKIYHQPSIPLNLKYLLEDMYRSLLINMRNLIRMVIFILLAWLLIIIPLAGGALSALTIFLVQSFYNGFSMSDYTLERKRYKIKERIRYSKENRALLVGVGAGFTTILMVPLLGWFLAPSYGTVAATIATLERIRPQDPVLKSL
ncbi:MAG: EI24 domain-containing protein [Desulfococcaceae bacterium]|jgi:CysZ protein|nr:EI24 domain-containing protein [Desulfococcaceae bacterium]